MNKTKNKDENFKYRNKLKQYCNDLTFLFLLIITVGAILARNSGIYAHSKRSEGGLMSVDLSFVVVKECDISQN